jgi:hypothetical protein
MLQFRIDGRPRPRKRKADRHAVALGSSRNALAAAALLALASAALAGCNSTPTVPVPPPEFCGVTAPDTEGLAVVTCEEGETARNVALVYNDNWGSGVMQETNDDGSFAAEVEANPGDGLIVQMKYGYRLSAEVYLVVPTE